MIKLVGWLIIFLKTGKITQINTKTHTQKKIDKEKKKIPKSYLKFMGLVGLLQTNNYSAMLRALIKYCRKKNHD